MSRIKKKGKSVMNKITKTLSSLGKSLSKGTKKGKGKKAVSLFVPKMPGYKTKRIKAY